MPKRQSREIQAVVAAGPIAAIEEESGVNDWVIGCAVWEKETGKERRELVALGAAGAAEVGLGMAAGETVGHLVVNRGKRVGSKAAGLAAKAVVREAARKVL